MTWRQLVSVARRSYLTRCFRAAGALALACLVAGEARGTTQAPGPLATARRSHTATFLQNGLVLIAGGLGPSGPLASAELFNPETGLSTPIADMPAGVYNHTATLLPDGTVLVAGGTGAAGAVSSCAIYYPLEGGWVGTTSLAQTRSGHTATSLADGRVLVVGGVDSHTVRSGAEIYDVSDGTWTATGSLATGRYGHSAVRLPDGRVLVAGGQIANLPSALYTGTAEVWRPAGTFTAAGTMATARRSFTLTVQSSGYVVATGGNNAGTLASAERYSIAGDTWSALGTLVTARKSHTAALLPDGRVLVSGGFSSTNAALGTMEENVSGQSTWTAVETGAIRGYHTSTLLPGGRVYLAGGSDATGGVALATGEIVDRGNPEWSSAGTVWGRSNGTATLLPNGKVLVLGAVSSGEATRGSLFDPTTGIWSFTAGTMVVPRYGHTATLLRDGRVLIAGGRTLGGALTQANEIYDDGTDAFTATGSFPGGVSWANHTALLLPTGSVLLAGGTVVNFSLYSWDPASGLWSALAGSPTLSSRPTLTLLKSGRVLATSDLGKVHLYNPRTDMWRETNRRRNRTLGVVQVVLLRNGQVLFVEESGSLELFDPATELFSRLEPPIAGLPASGFSATILPEGRILFAGGLGGAGGTTPQSFAALYDPATGQAHQIVSLSDARGGHDATRLPDGRILVAGGAGVASCELLDPWPDLVASARPTVTLWPGAWSVGDGTILDGVGFLGASEASGGNGAAHSSAAYPSLLVQALEGGASAWVPPALVFDGWSATRVHTGDLPPLPAGRYTLTLFAAGVPSVSTPLEVRGCGFDVWAPITSTPQAVCQGLAVELSAFYLPGLGMTYLWTLPDGSTSTEPTLTFSNAQVSDSGVYTLATEVLGCPGLPDSVALRVAPYPETPVIDAPASLSVDETGTASVAAHVGSAYVWTLSSGTIVSGQGTSEIRFAAPSSAGTVTLTVVETVGGTCAQPQATATVSVTGALAATQYYSVAPCRLFDTRLSAGVAAAAPALEAGQTRIFTIGTRCDLSSSTTRTLSVNLTATGSPADGELVLYRGDLAEEPVTSNLSFQAGRTRANNGMLELSRAGDGTFKVKNRSTDPVHFILDVNGTFR